MTPDCLVDFLGHRERRREAPFQGGHRRRGDDAEPAIGASPAVALGDRPLDLGGDRLGLWPRESSVDRLVVAAGPLIAAFSPEPVEGAPVNAPQQRMRSLSLA